MCGIMGIVSLEKPGVPISGEAYKARLEKLNEIMVHRCPDSGGSQVKDPMGFGFRRPSILDLRSTADQPVHSANCSAVIVFNR
jgi:asparagine synthase (glutamine-hydrolysing)